MSGWTHIKLSVSNRTKAIKNSKIAQVGFKLKSTFLLVRLVTTMMACIDGVFYPGFWGLPQTCSTLPKTDGYDS